MTLVVTDEKRSPNIIMNFSWTVELKKTKGNKHVKQDELMMFAQGVQPT